MAKTVAERQAAYRAGRDMTGVNGNGERRLNTWIDSGAHFALKRLAKHLGLTRKQTLEQLILIKDAEILSTIELDSYEWSKYMEQH